MLFRSEIEYQPGVKINRGIPIYNIAEYGTAVREALQKTTPLDLELTAAYDPATRGIDITIDATSSENVSGKLQVWVIENNIVNTQYMPDGSINTGYVHQHVFRTSVTNDIFGDDFSVTDTTPSTTTYQVVLDEDWIPENVAVVAFVSNAADGVLQVVKTALTTSEQ